MKLRFALVSSFCLALAACGQQSGPEPASQQSAETSQDTAAQARHGQPQQPLTAEDIAQIKATGKTGLWSDELESCSNAWRPRSRATLTWNVTGQADKVVVVLVGRKGNQRVFANGTSIGRKQTGKWLRSGMTFKLLNAVDRAELGSVTFTEKHCG